MSLTVTDRPQSPTAASGAVAATGPVSALSAIRDALSGSVEALDAAALAPDEAAVVVEQCAAIERLAQAGKLLAATRAAESDGWRRRGHRDAADWVAATTKCTKAEAAAVLDTSQRLVDQPALETAVRHGSLTTGQATVISDAAAVDPTATDTLLDTAQRSTLHELRERAAARKAAARGDDERRRWRLWRDRHLHQGSSADGAATLAGATTPEAGAIIAAALNPYRELAFQASKAAGRRDSFAALTADALEMLAAAAIGATPTCLLPQPGDRPTGSDRPGVDVAGGGGPRSHEPPTVAPIPGHDPSTGEPSPDRPRLFDSTIEPRPDRSVPGARRHRDPAGRPPDPDGSSGPAPPRDPSTDPPGEPPGRPDGLPDHLADALGGPPDTLIPWDPSPTGGTRLPGGRVKVIVRVDHTALARGHTAAGETCEITGLGPVPVASVLQLLRTGDPFLAAVVTHGTDVISVAHLGRQATAHQRTAIEWRDPRCVIDGCPHTFGEIDHNHDWHLTHQTHAPGLALLCPHHHRLKSRGWHLTGTGNHRRLLPPDHRDHPDHRSDG